MEKTLLKLGLLSICVSSLLSSEVNLNDEKVVTEIGISAFSKNIKDLTKMKEKAGFWYLYFAQKEEFDRVKQDEFEFEDSKEKAFNKFIEINKDNKFIGKSSNLMLSAEFEKYNFKKQHFPVKALSDSSYITYKGEYDSAVDTLKLVFDNTNSEYSFLPMVKSQAKQFIKDRKHSNGNVNRKLAINYHYTIKDIVNDNTLISFKKCDLNERIYQSCNTLSLRLPKTSKVTVIGHITKMEIVDSRGNILHTYSKF